ncbi:T9SS type B sorting domain-containing protein [Flavobacterium sp. MAH-1]|uniref:T9SS type B sorting domain-containing protein n=1 Tax=Flavobacterium agri TaxID=2743471 RepID=A0A7Y9C724_9FLAO|nr:choice-of-anchor L domain-containing protein [Flavobacterium agri]NUY80959.1 T9SS type B sorting domain-containing protein [Flavobacterium agri]NYA70983.1 T9SS type B sorting domain-containing protein [Flavobacterium agri]
MKKFLLILTVAFSFPVFAQSITVNTNSYSVPQLVNNVLINSPCVEANNITWSTGTNFGSTNGIGYFQNTNPNFPMQAGVILSTGDALHSVGPNTSMLNDGAANWPGDPSLETTLAQAGISMNSTNATVLEFDFTPISPQFNFDFVFASEEYGNFQCQFSDAFAFLLTNMNTGVTTNLAVVPSTNLPISVVTIRDFLYNSSCPSANAQYFGSFNGGSAAAGSATNFNGQTVLMNASSTLTPNTPYHIKLVIADRTDAESDSAIFIASDSFNIGQQVLGLDLTVANHTAICFGQTYVLSSGLNPAEYTFSWKRNNLMIPGATGPSINVIQPGTYSVTYAPITNSCQATTDSINIEFYPEFTTPNPTTLYKCDTGAASYSYNLALNTPIVTAGLPSGTTVAYFASEANANNNASPLPSNYSSPGNQTVYVRINNPATGCFTVKPFQLSVTNGPTITQPQNITTCERSLTQHFATINLNNQTAGILNGQSPALNLVTYHATQADANSGANPYGVNTTATNGQVIYVRVQNVSDTNCFVTTSFTVTVLPLPEVDVLEDVIVCENYVLPALTNGNYFTAPGGTGDPLFAGDVITETQTIYIFNQPGGPPNCSSASNFKVTIVDPLTMSPGDGTYCGSYTVGTPEYGAFFTQPGGQGSPIPAGTQITSSQTLYYYFITEVAPFCVIDTDFDVTIVNNVNVGTFDNVFNCTSYTLPTLAVGNYYTQPGGQGATVAAGTVVTATTTYYVFAQTGTAEFSCTSEDSFTVFIGMDVPSDVNQCAGYPLPALPIGNYYTGPGGTGTLLPAGTVIATPQTVYIYVAGGTDCDPDRHFNLNISQPPIDSVPNQSVCGGFVLPALTNGEYFTGSGGTGDQLSAGDLITTTQTIYIYKQLNASCSNQNSFTVTINPAPPIDSRSNIDVCNSYTLTPLGVGNYYTGPGGTGTMLPAGTVITETQVLYIYAQSTQAPFCTAENSFEISIFSIEADSPAPVTACDSYVLQPLTVGNYFKNSGGPTNNAEGDALFAGNVITASTTLYIYTESGERINCIDENQFQITINNSPQLASIANQFVCNSYELPVLAQGDYYTGPNKTGTQLHAGDILTTSQTVYVYAETGTTPNCTDEVSFNLTIFNVDELPAVTTCESYTLPALTIGSYYTGPGGTGNHLNAGAHITQTATIYVYAHSPFNPSCTDESSFVVTIVPEPVANAVPAATATTCDEDGTNDGLTAFDLSALTATVLGSQTGSEFSVTYHESMSDATSALNPVTSTSLPNVFVRVVNSLAPNCFDVRAIALHVNKLPEPTPQGGIICFDSETQTLLNPFVIHSGLSASTHTFQWLNEAGDVVGTSSNYTAVLPGDYTVIAVSNATGCISMPVTVTVQGSEPAVVTYQTSPDFSDNMSITITAVGTGDYEYQLDEGAWQDSNVFENVTSGTHIVTVRDKNGCGTAQTTALVVNYPHFFTPNGDGANDTWNIKDLKAQLNSKISIFDRYGKLLTQITPNGQGWDGTYNGKVMPSTDYWFTVNYTEGGKDKEFRAHFSMKR